MQNRQLMRKPTQRTDPGCDPREGCNGLVFASLSKACHPARQSSSRPRRYLATLVPVTSNLARPRTACHDIPEFRKRVDSSLPPQGRNSSATRESAHSPISFGPEQPRRDERACTTLPAGTMSERGAPAILASGIHFQFPTGIVCPLYSSSTYPVLRVHPVH